MLDSATNGRRRRAYELYVAAEPEQVRRELAALAGPRDASVEIGVVGAACHVVVVPSEGAGERDWPAVLSALKTLLETGRPLDLGAA